MGHHMPPHHFRGAGEKQKLLADVYECRLIQLSLQCAQNFLVERQ